jgi:hypothetical protein
MEVKDAGWTGIDDSQYNGNKEVYGDQEKVEYNTSMCLKQLLYAVWPRLSYSEILWDINEQLPVNIG